MTPVSLRPGVHNHQFNNQYLHNIHPTRQSLVLDENARNSYATKWIAEVAEGQRVVSACRVLCTIVRVQGVCLRYRCNGCGAVLEVSHCCGCTVTLPVCALFGTLVCMLYIYHVPHY